jgi:hypothetical protein
VCFLKSLQYNTLFQSSSGSFFAILNIFFDMNLFHTHCHFCGQCLTRYHKFFVRTHSIPVHVQYSFAPSRPLRFIYIATSIDTLEHCQKNKKKYKKQKQFNSLSLICITDSYDYYLLLLTYDIILVFSPC